MHECKQTIPYCLGTLPSWLHKVPKSTRLACLVLSLTLHKMPGTIRMEQHDSHDMWYCTLLLGYATARGVSKLKNFVTACPPCNYNIVVKHILIPYSVSLAFKALQSSNQLHCRRHTVWSLMKTRSVSPSGSCLERFTHSRACPSRI